MSTFVERTSGREFQIRVNRRPMTLNAERKLHHMARAKQVRELREYGAWLATQQNVPALKAIYVDVEPHLRGNLQDADACHPTVKALIDGLVDAGVLADDTPDIVLAIRYVAPVKSSSDYVILTLREAIVD